MRLHGVQSPKLFETFYGGSPTWFSMVFLSIKHCFRSLAQVAAASLPMGRLCWSAQGPTADLALLGSVKDRHEVGSQLHDLLLDFTGTGIV